MARKRRVFFRTAARRLSRREVALRGAGAARAVWVRRERRPLAAFWNDPDRRRALLLSVLLHAAVLLGVVWLSAVPNTVPEPEELIVLELTPPQGGVSERAAAAVSEPAPPGPDAQVAGNASENVRAAPSASAPEAPARPETAQSEPLPPSESPPLARLPGETTAESPDLPVRNPANTLLDIEAAEVAPQPLEDALALPTPDPDAVVTLTRRALVTPQVTVTESQALPTPEVAAEVASRTVPEPQVGATVAEARAVPQPDVQAEVARAVPEPQVGVVVAEAQAVPQPDVAVTIVTRRVALPQVQAEVAEGDAIPRPEVAAEVASRAVPEPRVDAVVSQAQVVPQPDVQAEVARAVPEPQVGAVVAEAQAVPQPDVAAQVASRDVPEPQVGAVVSEPEAVPQPSVSSSVVAGERVPRPQVGAVVTEAQPLAVTPGAALSEAVAIVTPNASATVAPQAAADAGDGPRNAQADADATAAGQGAASDGLGVEEVGVANVQSFEVTLERPLAVLIDNADAAYPQQGLVEASGVFEMPVEGGLTRLMSVYTKDDPAQVGPIRSARDYFVEAALSMNGTLVHVGGAPSAVSRIASLEAEGFGTLDALEQGTLFAQAPDRSAPHSTFATGTALRDSVGRLESQVNGTLYAPPADAENVSSLTVGYSAVYTSGFYYLPGLDRYRWVRSGADAADTAGRAVAADAVIVARIVTVPQNDPEGRLYLPYSGGEATLYLRGKAVPGTWTPEGGFSFSTQTGLEVDLTPFKHWILFAPEEATLEQG